MKSPSHSPWLTWIQSFAGRPAIRRRAGSLEFQKLEPRMLLAGDVTVFVDNLQLFVEGDGAANQVQIIGSTNGSARVVGLDGTTINGSQQDFVAGFPGLRNAFVNLNGGDDSVDILGARFNFGLIVRGQAGNDSMMVRNGSLGNLVVEGGSGNDIIQIDQVFVRETSNIDLGSGSDLLAVYNHAVGDNLSIQGRAGNDTIAIDQMGMSGQLNLNTGAGNDQVLLAGETWISSQSNLMLGSGDDFLGAMPGQNQGHLHIQRQVTVDLGGGNDQVVLDDHVHAGMGTEIHGNQGLDSYQGDPNGNKTLTGFENQNFNVQQALEKVYAEISDAGLDPALFGGFDVSGLDIQNSTTPLTYTENDAPTSVDPFLKITQSNGIPIQSATVSIDGFQAGQDELSGTGTGNLSVNFDPTTGVLTINGIGTAAEYESVLRSVRYQNTSDLPSESPRTLDFNIQSSEDSASSNRTLNVFAVNDLPELNVPSRIVPFDQDNPNLDRPLVIDSQIMVDDLDNPQLPSAQVSIVSGFQLGDLLDVASTNGITVDYDATVGVLNLTGNGTLEEFEQALRNVTFDHVQDAIPLGTRTVQFEITDGVATVNDQVDIVVTASETIQVNVSNDPLTYSETDAPTPIDPQLTVEASGGDPNAVITGASVQIASGFDPNFDELSFTPVAGINGSYDASTGLLTFTGNAGASEYEALLRQVSYHNTSFGNFGFTSDPRVIDFSVQHEGLDGTAQRIINVTELTPDEELIQRYLELNNMTSQTTASGLHYIINETGDGDFPDANSEVTVNYRGTFLDGTEFDSGDDVTFSLQSVIEGWTEGIPKFSRGASGMLLIPSDLAYGEAGAGNSIPPNSVLVFEIELLDFNSGP